MKREPRIGVAALSGPCEADRLDAGVEELRRLGLEPVLADNLTLRAGPCGFFAGADNERLAGFQSLLDRSDLDGIVFARGGHGVLPLLPRLDWARIARRVRAGLVLCGYSDLTPLLLEVVRRTGCVALHGPMVAVDLARGLDDREAELFLAGLHRSFASRHTVRLHGELTAPVSGTLLGGCLSLLVGTLGTAYAPLLAGALVFCEDVDEPVYRRDRMLTHLHLSGSLSDASGLIFGHFEPRSEGEEVGWNEVIRGFSERSRRPVASGLEAGHGEPNFTLALGAHAILSPDGSLMIDHPRPLIPHPGRTPAR